MNNYIYIFIFHTAAGPFDLQSAAAMSSGSGHERTSQGKRSATSQTSSEVGSPSLAQAKKQKGEGQGGSASFFFHIPSENTRYELAFLSFSYFAKIAMSVFL